MQVDFCKQVCAVYKRARCSQKLPLSSIHFIDLCICEIPVKLWIAPLTGSTQGKASFSQNNYSEHQLNFLLATSISIGARDVAFVSNESFELVVQIGAVGKIWRKG